MYLSPQLTDDLLMLKAKSRNGMINNPTPIVAAHAAEQMRDRTYTELAGRHLGLGEKNLAENQRQFTQRMQFGRESLEDYKDRSNAAAAIAALGLGIQGVDKIASENSFEQRIQAKKDMIDQFKKLGDKNSLFFADLLELLE